MYEYLRVKDKIKVLSFYEAEIQIDTSRNYETTIEKLHSKHETESLGDGGLFDLTRVRHITTSLSFSIVYFA